MKMQLVLTIHRPPKEVYAVISDLERIPEWVKSAVAARCVAGTPRRPGARYQTVTKFLGRRLTETLELTEVQPERMFAMKAVAGTFPHALAYRLDPAPAGTKVTVNVSAEPGRFFLLAGPLLEAVMKRQLATNLRDLKALIEAPAQSVRQQR